MERLQAKTEEQQEHIKDLFSEGLLDSFYFDIDKEWVEIPCSYDKDVSNYITFDTMAKIVDYLRCQRGKHEIAMCEECARLLDENRKLFNEWERLKKENETLKEKTKHLPRIATLNKRIHELRQENEKLVRQLSKKGYKEKH